MATVGIGELKNHLSAYLDRVRRGEEVIVRDRSHPIAKIVPLTQVDDLDAQQRRLVAEGALRPPTAVFDRAFWSVRAPRIATDVIAAAVSADRDDS